MKSEPWRKQHDPDFDENGTISVFNNFLRRSVESNIQSVDPMSNEVLNLFDGGNLLFYTTYMGLHQKLPGGGMLVVSPGEGRVLEVDAKGMVQFEYFNIVNEKSLGHIQNAVWLDDHFFDSIPVCN